MNHLRTITIVFSFVIATLNAIIFAIPSAHASELLPSLINTAVAKEPVADILTTDQRIAILKQIITSSQDEIINLTDKLKGLQLDDQWSIARDHFIDTLATSSEHYAKIETQLDNENISLDEIKMIAKDLKDWRESTYTSQLKEAGNLILVFQVENVRSIIEARDTKISNDLKKLDRQGLVNTDTLKKYLSQAEKSIDNARNLNDKAKDLYYTVSVLPLQPKNAVKPSEADASQAARDAVIADTTTQKGPEKDAQDEVRDLSTNSLKELKTAYELFFRMNDRIRK